MLELLKKRKEERDVETEELKKEIEHCIFLMSRNEAHFNMASDEDLIESQIYERQALRCQYNYLLNRLRDKNGAEPQQQENKTGG